MLLYPEKVISFTSLSSLFGITDEDYKEIGARIRPPFFRDLPHSFQELSPSYRAGDPEGLRLWEDLALKSIPGERIHSELTAPITWKRISALKVPTLLITGDGDLYLPPAMMRLQAQHIPHAEVRIVDEAGHAANWEQPKVFNDIFLDFLQRSKA